MKGSQWMGGGRIFLKTFWASRFNKDLLNEPNVSRIHLALNLKKVEKTFSFGQQSERCSQVFVACSEDNFYIFLFFYTFCFTLTDANYYLLFHCNIFFFFTFLKGKLITTSAEYLPANTPPMMERARMVLPQKVPRYRGARGPTTQIS